MKLRLVAGWALGPASVAALGQMQANGGAGRSTSKIEAVTFLYPEQVTIAAGKPATVTLHFSIRTGLHINSHTPSEEELIPTTLSIPDGFGVRLEGASYPPGTEFALPFAPKEKLSVYTGDFTIKAQIVATPGDHMVEAKLRYQACDNNACMPPRTITVAIDVIGK